MTSSAPYGWKADMRPLLSVRYLAHRIGIPLEELRDLAENIDTHYSEFSETDEKTGKTRTFRAPDKRLKLVQRRILRKILSDYSLPDTAHGGVKGKSPKTNAAQHVGKPLVVTLDIRNFYPSVSHHQVARMFRREFGCGNSTTWLLTRLTTIDGQLPQGAPTSTAIANILLASTVDQPAERYAARHGVVVTRFVDDFGFSGEKATTLINNTAASASRIGLRTWRKRKKLKIMPASQRQEVTGLTVNAADGPSVPKYKRDRIRAAIHQLRCLSAAEVEKEIQSIDGRINHVAQHNTVAAKRLRQQFEQVLAEVRGR